MHVLSFLQRFRILCSGTLFWLLATRAAYPSPNAGPSVSEGDAAPPADVRKVAPATTSPGSSSQPYTLPAVTVTGVGAEESVLPTSQPNSSVYGKPFHHAAGDTHMLAGGATEVFELVITVLDGQAELDAVEAEAKRLVESQ